MPEFSVPSVCVVMAVRDPDPGFLASAIRSVLEQRMTAWSLVVVDDGSTTDIAALLPSDPRLRYVRIDPHGVSVARNVGVSCTSAEIICFLDGDDVWHPGRLEADLRAFDDPSVVAVDHGFVLVDEADNVLPQRYKPSDGSYLQLIQACSMIPSATAVRRSVFLAVGGFDPFMRYSEDWDLFLRLAHHGKIAPSPGDLVAYRLHATSASTNYRATYRAARVLLSKVDASARNAHRRDVVLAVKVGNRHVRRLYAEQAVTKARARRRQDKVVAVSDIAFAAVVSPWVLLRNIKAWAGARLSPRSEVDVAVTPLREYWLP